MSELFYSELLPYEMLEELRLGGKYALLAKDTLTWRIPTQRPSKEKLEIPAEALREALTNHFFVTGCSIIQVVPLASLSMMIV